MGMVPAKGTELEPGQLYLLVVLDSLAKRGGPAFLYNYVPVANLQWSKL
jgi:hypothetical protein